MNIHTLLNKYGLEHGLEVDQRRLDAFVKELEGVMASSMYGIPITVEVISALSMIFDKGGK